MADVTISIGIARDDGDWLYRSTSLSGGGTIISQPSDESSIESNDTLSLTVGVNVGDRVRIYHRDTAGAKTLIRVAGNSTLIPSSGLSENAYSSFITFSSNTFVVFYARQTTITSGPVTLNIQSAVTQYTGGRNMNDIGAFLGDPNPKSISDWYRGGSYVPNITENSHIPTSGAISLNDFSTLYK